MPWSKNKMTLSLQSWIRYLALSRKGRQSLSSKRSSKRSNRAWRDTKASTWSVAEMLTVSRKTIHLFKTHMHTKNTSSKPALDTILSRIQRHGICNRIKPTSTKTKTNSNSKGRINYEQVLEIYEWAITGDIYHQIADFAKKSTISRRNSHEGDIRRANIVTKLK